MKAVLIILLATLIVLTIMLSFPVLREWNYQFDAHGRYIGPDGALHWESVSERHCFLLLLSMLLLSITTIYSFKQRQPPAVK